MGIENIRQIKQKALLPKEKKIYYIPKVSAKKQAKIKEQKDSCKRFEVVSQEIKNHEQPGEYNKLDKWFEVVAQEIEKHPYCAECELQGIMTFISKRFYRAASAHIIPKSIFVSVATNPNNYLILAAGCGCHHKFDNGGMKDMLIFDKAVNRYNLFRYQIKERHKMMQIFENELENRISNGIKNPQ